MKNCNSCKYQTGNNEPETLPRNRSDPLIRRECSDCTPMGDPLAVHDYPNYASKLTTQTLGQRDRTSEL